MKTSLVFLLLGLAVCWAGKGDIVCKKRKLSKKISVGEGESYVFKTQAGRTYAPNTKCLATYRKKYSCPEMKFSCSKFNIYNKRKNCKGKDVMQIQANGIKKNYCQKKGPVVLTNGNTMKVTFLSDRRKQSSGAVCRIECVDLVEPQTEIQGWTDEDLEHINTTVQSFMTEHNVVGSSLALVKDGRLVYAKGFGVMDKDTRKPVQSTSVFRIASLSKPITSAAIMILSERIPGLLERTVFGSGGILGTTYGTLPYSEYETQVTIKHLLEHTAGGDAWQNGAQDPMNQHLTDDHDELFGWVLDTRDPSKKPGTEFAYSNFGYNVLGRVIEKLSGKSYESFVRNNILNPIGAFGMTIGKSKKSERYPNEVTYHSSGSAYYPEWNIERRDANGGWISSAADYARFLMHFDGSDTKTDLISRSTYDLMTEGSDVYPGYAKGWSVNPAHDNIWQGGSLPGTKAYAMNVAKSQWGSFETSAVFIMNSDDGGDKMDPLLWNIQIGIKNWP